MTNKDKALQLAELVRTPDEDERYYNSNRCKIYDKCLEMARWKDEQIKQILFKKTKLLSPSAAQDSVKRCTIEEIYRELFGEEKPNSNPYIK